MAGIVDHHQDARLPGEQMLQMLLEGLQGDLAVGARFDVETR